MKEHLHGISSFFNLLRFRHSSVQEEWRDYQISLFCPPSPYSQLPMDKIHARQHLRHIGKSSSGIGIWSWFDVFLTLLKN